MNERIIEEKIEKRTETCVEPEVSKQRPNDKDRWIIEKPETTEKPKEENKD